MIGKHRHGYWLYAYLYCTGMGLKPAQYYSEIQSSANFYSTIHNIL